MRQRPRGFQRSAILGTGTSKKKLVLRKKNIPDLDSSIGSHECSNWFFGAQNNELRMNIEYLVNVGSRSFREAVELARMI